MISFFFSWIPLFYITFGKFMGPWIVSEVAQWLHVWCWGTGGISTAMRATAPHTTQSKSLILHSTRPVLCHHQDQRLMNTQDGLWNVSWSLLVLLHDEYCCELDLQHTVLHQDLHKHCMFCRRQIVLLFGWKGMYGNNIVLLLGQHEMPE